MSISTVASSYNEISLKELLRVGSVRVNKNEWLSSQRRTESKTEEVDASYKESRV